MVWRMSLHQVPWIESEPVKKSTNERKNIKRFRRIEDTGWSDLQVTFDQESSPVTCVALASVRIKARFSSSDSADSTVLGSLRKRVNWGCTSELPRAVISRRAVLSTLRKEVHRAQREGSRLTPLGCFYTSRVWRRQGTYHRCSWFWLVWGTAARLCR